MDQDSYGVILTGPSTCREIAKNLKDGQGVIIGWTDNALTVHDILFTLRPIQFGTLNTGLRGPRDLFVSVLRIGAFGFDASARSPLHWTYIQEKLGIHAQVTAEPLAALIQGVRDALSTPDAASP